MEFQIAFRPFRMDDASFVNRLRQQEDMESKLGGSKRPVALERDVKWIENIILNDNPTAIYFAVTPLGSEEIVGYASITDIDFRNGSCFWSGIKLDPAKAGKGWGTQVALKILKFVFEELRMERCKGECLEHHEAVLKMLSKIGFKIEGLTRNSVYKNGVYNSQYILSVIRSEYIDIKQKFEL